jgi:universal stress protein A
MTIHKILAPVDYSEHSHTALAFAVEIARRFDAKIDVVHVWDRPTYVTDAVMVSHGQAQRPIGEMIRENAEHDMREFMAKAALPAELLGRQSLVPGDPATALLKEIEREKYDLVVLGTHGRTGLLHLLLGSVAEKLVRHSTTPVLTVPHARG